MIKDPARPMPMPQGTPTENPQMFNQAPPELEEQAAGIVDKVVTYIYADGVDDILSEMSDGSPEKLGGIAGNLVTNEIAMEEEGGNMISRDIEIEIMAEVVHELTDLALEKGLVDLQTEQQEQSFMGQALTHAINAAMASDDTQVTDDSIMQLATQMLNKQGQQPAGGMLTQGNMNEQSI